MLPIVKEKNENGEIVIREAKPEELPKDHQWLLILKEMKERGMADKFKFVYGNEVLDKPLKFAYDEIKGGIGVQKPDKVLLIKTEIQGYWKEDKVVGEIDFRKWADPDFEESLNILKMVDEI